MGELVLAAHTGFGGGARTVLLLLGRELGSARSLYAHEHAPLPALHPQLPQCGLRARTLYRHTNHTTEAKSNSSKHMLAEDREAAAVVGREGGIRGQAAGGLVAGVR
jgi:hypothetical protein